MSCFLQVGGKLRERGREIGQEVDSHTGHNADRVKTGKARKTSGVRRCGKGRSFELRQDQA